MPWKENEQNGNKSTKVGDGNLEFEMEIGNLIEFIMQITVLFQSAWDDLV